VVVTGIFGHAQGPSQTPDKEKKKWWSHATKLLDKWF